MKFLLSLVLLFSIKGYTQSSSMKPDDPAITSSSDTSKHKSIRICCTAAKIKREPPLFILNGYVVADSILSKISPSQIQAIQVLKDDAALKQYGPKAKYGVINITARQEVVDDLTKRGLLTPIL